MTINANIIFIMFANQLLDDHLLNATVPRISSVYACLNPTCLFWADQKKRNLAALKMIIHLKELEQQHVEMLQKYKSRANESAATISIDVIESRGNDVAEEILRIAYK
jgi:hypothetical protein